MKAFLIHFFGLSSCFKVDAVESNHRDDYQRRRRRRRMEDDERSYASRSLVHIDENSTLQKTHDSSRRRTGDGSLNSGSIISSTQQRRPSKSGSSSSKSRSLRNKNVPRKPSFSIDRYEGRDDPHALGLSLSETMGHSYEEKNEYREVLDEQSAIRRSLKDQSQSSIRRKKYSSRLSSSSRSPNSQKTQLESFIDGHEKTSPPNDDDSIDNVTTISKASINPYRLLNVSQSATPRDVYHGYKQKLKETEMDGGGDKAFHDVGNAYRRIRAEIERQERRRTEQSKRKLTSKSNGNRDDSRRNTEKHRSKTRRQQRKYSTSSSSDFDDDEDSISSRATAIGARLKDHRELVNGLFANDNKALDQKSSSNGLASRNEEVTSLQNAVYNQSRMLSEMNIVPIDAGATNVNEKNETITNSCFYLSLAASYLSGVGAFTVDPTAIYSKRSLVNDDSNQTIEMEIATLPKREKQMTKKLALQLKRAIEAAVMLVHPDWASSGMVGEEVQAFSDFLVYALDSDSVLGHWSIAVFDEASGFVDVYRGRHYGKCYPPAKVKTRHGREKLRYKDCDVETKRENTLTLRYIPGHYQPLLPELTKMGNERRKRKVREAGKTYERATLEEILRLLKQWKVLHVVTDGRA